MNGRFRCQKKRTTKRYKGNEHNRYIYNTYSMWFRKWNTELNAIRTLERMNKKKKKTQTSYKNKMLWATVVFIVFGFSKHIHRPCVDDTIPFFFHLFFHCYVVLCTQIEWNRNPKKKKNNIKCNKLCDNRYFVANISEKWDLIKF